MTQPFVTKNPNLVRGNERPADVIAFEQSVVGFFVEAADMLGVPKSVAAIYGICFASPEPLGFSEINGRLEISSGSISQGLKFLREVGALKVSESPGSLVSGPLPALSLSNGSLVQRAARQRERYEPDMELRNLALHFIEERLEKQLTAGKSRLEAIHAAVPSGDNGSARELKARIKALQTWNSKGRALVPLIKSFLKLT
ncbi:MAG: hypothetical protein Q7S40_32430 [Opitutaceae bacterium]|nr:hypothetical protein [Opitutaceae bacterium]